MALRPLYTIGKKHDRSRSMPCCGCWHSMGDNRIPNGEYESSVSMHPGSSRLDPQRRYNSRAIKSFESRARPPISPIPAARTGPSLIHGAVTGPIVLPADHCGLFLQCRAAKNQRVEEEGNGSREEEKKIANGTVAAAGYRTGSRESHCFNLSTNLADFLSNGPQISHR